jgi:outer membrane protein TolC
VHQHSAVHFHYYFEGEIRRAEVELQIARDSYERTRALAVGEIAKSRADLGRLSRTALRFREVAAEGSPQRGPTTAEYAYSRGAMGVMDLLDARRQLFATRLEASSTEANYAKALAAWQAAIAVVELPQEPARVSPGFAFPSSCLADPAAGRRPRTQEPGEHAPYGGY